MVVPLPSKQTVRVRFPLSALDLRIRHVAESPVRLAVCFGTASKTRTWLQNSCSSLKDPSATLFSRKP